jgi:hypothetical protein
MPTAEIEPAGWYEQRIDALELIGEINRLRERNHALAAELTQVREENEALRQDAPHSGRGRSRIAPGDRLNHGLGRGGRGSEGKQSGWF